jgi:hypothetical protein
MDLRLNQERRDAQKAARGIIAGFLQFWLEKRQFFAKKFLTFDLYHVKICKPH